MCMQKASTIASQKYPTHTHIRMGNNHHLPEFGRPGIIDWLKKEATPGPVILTTKNWAAVHSWLVQSCQKCRPHDRARFAQMLNNEYRQAQAIIINPSTGAAQQSKVDNLFDYPMKHGWMLAPPGGPAHVRPPVSSHETATFLSVLAILVVILLAIIYHK